jgi:hypothetical protein
MRVLKNQDGMILILALGMILMISVGVVVLLKDAAQEAQRVALAKQRTEALNIAEAGLARAVSLIDKDRNTCFDKKLIDLNQGYEGEKAIKRRVLMSIQKDFPAENHYTIEVIGNVKGKYNPELKRFEGGISKRLEGVVKVDFETHEGDWPVIASASQVYGEGVYINARNWFGEVKIVGNIFSDREISFRGSELDKVVIEGDVISHGEEPVNINKITVNGQVITKEVGEEPLLSSCLPDFPTPEILEPTQVEVEPLPPLEPDLSDPPWISEKGSTKEEILDRFKRNADLVHNGDLTIKRWPIITYRPYYRVNRRVYVKGNVKWNAPRWRTYFGRDDWLVAKGDIIFPDGRNVYIGRKWDARWNKIGLVAGGNIRSTRGAIRLRVRLYAFGNIELVAHHLLGDWIQARGDIILKMPWGRELWMKNDMRLRNRQDVKAGRDIRVLTGANFRNRGLNCVGGYWSAGRACIINVSSTYPGGDGTPTEIRTGGTVPITVGNHNANIRLASAASNCFKTFGRPHRHGREVDVGILLFKGGGRRGRENARVQWDTSLHAQGDIYVFSRGKCGFYFGYKAHIAKTRLEVRTRGNFITAAAHLGYGGSFFSSNFEIGKDAYFFDISRAGLENVIIKAKGTEGQVDVGDHYPARRRIVDKGIIWVSKGYKTKKHYIEDCRFYTEQGIAIISTSNMRVRAKGKSEFYCNKDFYTHTGHLGKVFDIPEGEVKIHAGRNIIFRNYGGEGDGIMELRAGGGEEIINIGDHRSRPCRVKPGIILASRYGHATQPVKGKWYSGKSITFVAYNSSKELYIQPEICNADEDISFIKFRDGKKFAEIAGNYHAGGDITIGSLACYTPISGIYKAGGNITIDLYPKSYHCVPAGFWAKGKVEIGNENNDKLKLYGGCIVGEKGVKIRTLVKAIYDPTVANKLFGSPPAGLGSTSVSSVQLIRWSEKCEKFE